MLLSSFLVSLDKKVFDFKSIIVSLTNFKFNNHNNNEKEMEEKEILENYDINRYLLTPQLLEIICAFIKNSW